MVNSRYRTGSERSIAIARVFVIAALSAVVLTIGGGVAAWSQQDDTLLSLRDLQRRYVPGRPAAARTGPALPVGKCLNYAGQLEVRRDTPDMRPVVPADFASMKRRGFATLRMPVTFDRHALDAPPYTVDPQFLDRVERATRDAVAAGLNVIIDNHYNDALMKDPAAYTPRFVAIWDQVARRFASAPASVWFEIVNEPHGKLTAQGLPAVFEPALAAIRRTNPNRPVILGGENWSDVASLATLPMPDDPNVVPTFHYYEPMRFTHQGAQWLKPPPPVGTQWGSAADLRLLDRRVDAVRRYMQQTGRVPFIGEYGVIPGVPTADRARYHAAVTRAFAATGVQSCIWGYYNNFAIRDSKGWIASLVDPIATTRD